MARQAKPPRRPRQQPTGNAIGVHPADRRLWQRGRVRRARPPCCWTPTTSPGPNHLCGLCQLLHRGQHRGSDGELLRFPERSVRRPAHEDGVLALVKKRRGGDLDCGPTFNLLRGTNVLRNLSVAGALTASYQNWDSRTATPGAKPSRKRRRRVQLRQQLPGRLQDHHGSAGLLHPDRSRSANHKRPRERGSLELLHAGPTWPTSCLGFIPAPSWIRC